ncbi:uncharacterized protein B0T23DRAFT_385337 [Neurospora hispaniola]|uniref:Uncharacterized protein n=1 Tax=Neurospora hispaniola TaxID=588809 RepID=A0AAJ0I493_9PEZI|nr:hypothetical protein B0T23DRAFT_385337 [Neurospora hispaniola]
MYRWKSRQGAGLTIPIVGLAVLRSTGSLESITSSDTLPVITAEKKVDQGAQKHMNRCVYWVPLKSDGLQNAVAGYSNCEGIDVTAGITKLRLIQKTPTKVRIRSRESMVITVRVWRRGQQ